MYILTLLFSNPPQIPPTSNLISPAVPFCRGAVFFALRLNRPLENQNTRRCETRRVVRPLFLSGGDLSDTPTSFYYDDHNKHFVSAWLKYIVSVCFVENRRRRRKRGECWRARRAERPAAEWRGKTCARGHTQLHMRQPPGSHRLGSHHHGLLRAHRDRDQRGNERALLGRWLES